MLNEQTYEQQAKALCDRLWNEIDPRSRVRPHQDSEVTQFYYEVHKAANRLDVMAQSEVVLEALMVLRGPSVKPTGNVNLKGGAGYALYVQSGEIALPDGGIGRHDGSAEDFLKFLCRREAEKRRRLQETVDTPPDIENLPGSLSQREPDILDQILLHAPNEIMITWLEDRVLTSKPADPDSSDEVHTLVRNLRRQFEADWNTIQDSWWGLAVASFQDRGFNVDDGILTDVMNLAHNVEVADVSPEGYTVHYIEHWFEGHIFLSTARNIDHWFEHMPPFPVGLEDANGDAIHPEPPKWWIRLYEVGRLVRGNVYEDLEILYSCRQARIRTPRSYIHSEFIAVDQALLAALVRDVFAPVQNSGANSPKEVE